MEGFHYSGNGGEIESSTQEFASILLPPGAYIVFAKAYVSTNEKGFYTFQADLHLGGEDSDSLQFYMITDSPLEPGYQSNRAISLNCAGFITEQTRAVLKFGRSDVSSPPIFVSQPRLSAIQVSKLHWFPISDVVGVEPAPPLGLLLGPNA